MKQPNKLVITVSNSFILFTFLVFACLTLNNNSGMPHFGPQQNNSAKVYRPDSFNRIYDNRNRLEQLRTAEELAKLIVIQKQLNPDLPADNKNTSTNSTNNSSSNSENIPSDSKDYNPFTHGDLNEKFYDLHAYLSSKYRIKQEQKYPYLISRRHKLEHAQHLAREITAAKNLRLSSAATKLIYNYNKQLNLAVALPASMDNQISGDLEFESLADLPPCDLQIPPDFFRAKFNQRDQQLLHARHFEIINTIADHKIFAPHVIGLQDFSNTVLETIVIAHKANRVNKIEIATAFTDLAHDFTALGRGLIKGGYNFVGNIVQAGSNLILHPINTTRIMGVNLWQLANNLTVGLGEAVVTLASYDPDADIFSEGMEIESERSQAQYHKFIKYLEVTPRAEKFEKIGQVIGDQLFSIATTLIAGKTVALISDAALVAKLQQAIIAKKKANKTKSGNISWLNKFGVAGQDVAKALGLIAAEEYELAELNGLVINFKNSPASSQTLFNQAGDYFKHNKSGKKTKYKSAIKNANGAPQKVRIVNTVQRQEFFKKPNIKKNYRPIGNDGVWQKKPGVSGLKNAEYLQWDHKHNEVEAYNKKKIHLGALDPQTDEYYKPAVIGRVLNI